MNLRPQSGGTRLLKCTVAFATSTATPAAMLERNVIAWSTAHGRYCVAVIVVSVRLANPAITSTPLAHLPRTATVVCQGCPS